MHRPRRIWICSAIGLKIPSRHLSLALHFVLLCVLMQSTTLAYELPLPPRDPSMAAVAKEPITPIPLYQALDPRWVALGERLFNDVRLSHDNTRACTTCHPLERGGMDRGELVKRGHLTRPSFEVSRTFGASRVPGSLPMAEGPRCPQAQSLALGMCQLLPQS